MDAAALTLPFLFALIAVALAFDFLNGMNDAAANRFRHMQAEK